MPGTASVRLTFLGSGDAFSSGGRLQACLMVEHGAGSFLIDCGPGVLAGMHREGLGPGGLDLILLSHLHGDHIAGIPFLLLRAKHVERRTRPLVIAGPPGTRERLSVLTETMYPGTTLSDMPFDLSLVELQPDVRAALGDIAVTPMVVQHPSGAPAFALRVECDSRVIAYSGDTGWTETLVEAARDADLFICECNFYETDTPTHISYPTLAVRLEWLLARRTVLTHLSEEVLAHLDEIELECASDGLKLEL